MRNKPSRIYPNFGGIWEGLFRLYQVGGHLEKTERIKRLI